MSTEQQTEITLKPVRVWKKIFVLLTLTILLFIHINNGFPMAPVKIFWLSFLNTPYINVGFYLILIFFDNSIYCACQLLGQACCDLRHVLCVFSVVCAQPSLLPFYCQPHHVLVTQLFLQHNHLNQDLIKI